MKFDLLETDDLHAAWQLSVDQAWNQTAADWRRMIVLQPTGCFAARIGQRLVGTVTTITYGTALAWIGMMIVHANFRRRGIGAALMRLVLDSLQDSGVVEIMLDATPEGRPLYEALGFQIVSEFERWGGVAAPQPDESDRTSNGGTLDCLDICTTGPLTASALAARGLSKRRQLTRMRFGNNVDLATGWVVCASAGPELG